MKKLLLLICAALLLITAQAYADKDVPARGMVTMADIGSTTCIPCKMMEPVMENLRAAYKGRAAIIFVNIDKHPAAGREYGLRAIPTQIFYNNQGVEKWRHVGFLNQKQAAAKLDELLGK